MSEAWSGIVAHLLPELTERVPGWVVLKNHEGLPEVTGDIDLCVDRSRWDSFTDQALRVLSRLGDFSVVCCDHFPDLRLVFVVDIGRSSASASALELDLVDGIWWKGHRLLPAPEVAALAHDDRRGFRYASPGTEAAFHLTVESLGRLGSLKTAARHFSRIRDLAGQDEEGFLHAMERMHGRAGARAARHFMAGTWGPIEGWLLIARRIGRGPSGLYRRAAHWIGRKALRHWRGLPRDVAHGTEEWLARVGRGHRIILAGD